MAETASERTVLRAVSSRWTPVVDFFLDSYRKLGISNLEAMFIIHLLRFKWTAEMPYPSFKRIARMMGVSATAVRGHARRLEKKGLIKRKEQVGTTNRFDLLPLFQALERLQIELEQTGAETPAEVAASDVVF